ncbi:MAG: type II secretion system F family protein [Acidimicrobiia bacterium]
MSVALAVLLGLGVFLVFDGATRPRSTARRRATTRARMQAWLAAGGLGHVRPARFVGASVVIALGAAAIALVIVGSLGVALIATVAGALAPTSYLRARRRALRLGRQQAWPDAIELLAGAVRSGETLPAAIAVVAERGPAPLRALFGAIVRDHRVTGDLLGALDRAGATIADPTGDRVFRTLGIAHRVGGRELGCLLRTLSEFLREDLATRSEITSRQSWTVVAARVAAAAPWLVLVLVASRAQGASAFDSPTGVVVLIVGALVTVVGYRMMLRIGRLPEEPRVLVGTGA